MKDLDLDLGGEGAMQGEYRQKQFQFAGVKTFMIKTCKMEPVAAPCDGHIPSQSAWSES